MKKTMMTTKEDRNSMSSIRIEGCEVGIYKGVQSMGMKEDISIGI